MPLDELHRGRPTVKVLEATSRKSGEQIPLTLEATARVEIDLTGQPVLHLKASGSRASMEPYGANAVEALHALLEIRFVKQAP